ncbi:MAG: hypothetical protein WHS38_10135 [Thermodesulforhabdaceae bacterium]
MEDERSDKGKFNKGLERESYKEFEQGQLLDNTNQIDRETNITYEEEPYEKFDDAPAVEFAEEPVEEFEREERSLDLINSLAVYKAKEAGFFGRENIDAEDAGIIGATVTEFQKTTTQLVSGEISREQAKSELEEVISTSVKCFINRVAGAVLDVAATVIKNRIPILGKVIDGVKEFVKTKVVGYVADKVATAAKKVFGFFKKLFDI